jgi:FixJ family two-component response regulator
MAERTASVFIVDDDVSVRKALSRLFGAAGWSCRSYASPQDFLSDNDPAAPGCLVLDLAMPGMDGIELQRRLGGKRPIVFLTGRADVPSAVQAMRAGAVDFLTKPVGDVELLQTVEKAIAQDTRRRREEAASNALRARLATLTPRESEVFWHVVSGELNKQIANQLGIGEKTIKVHRAQVMEKMDAGSLAELVLMAERLRAARAGDAVADVGEGLALPWTKV